MKQYPYWLDTLATTELRGMTTVCPAIPLSSWNPWCLPLVGADYQVKDWLQ